MCYYAFIDGVLTEYKSVPKHVLLCKDRARAHGIEMGTETCVIV